MEDFARRRAVSGWMAVVWREAAERGITDAEAVIAFSHEAAMLLRAMVHSGDVRQSKIGVLVPDDAQKASSPEVDAQASNGHGR